MNETLLQDQESALAATTVVRTPAEIARAARTLSEPLLENEATFRVMFDCSPLPMWIYHPVSLAFLAVNEAAIRQYGYSREEFLAMTIKDICPSAEIAAALVYRTRMFEKDIPIGVARTVSWKQCKKDGTILDVELTSSPIATRAGNGVLVFAHDITEKKRAQRQINEQANLLDLANDAIIVTDLNARILFWNKGAESLYGWTDAEVAGQDRVELLESKPIAVAAANEEVLAKGDWSGELSHKTKAKKTIKVSSRWTLVRDDDGEPRSILIINTDITEKKQLESQFLRTQRLESIGTLASGIAHDLNNILAPILMSAGLLRRHVKDPENQKLLSSIEASAERGADIVRQVLTFARGIEGERIVLQPRHLVNELVKIMVQTFPKNIQIQTKFPRDLWPVTGDATQVHQVLLNLCVNARDAMPEGGTLLVGAENKTIDEHYTMMNADAVPGVFVMLQVSDTGSGIPADVAEKIFDPFFTTKEAGKGTGLGLSTVLGIVKSHGGFVSLDSRVGEGTTFRIFLPANMTAEAGPDQEQAAVIPDGKGELVLIVDDESSVRVAATKTLEAHGYRVYTAEDGTDALALYHQRRNEIQLVLSDIEMDLMDGVTLTRSLKKLDPQVRVIISSGQNRPDQRNTLKSLGVTAFLDKPYNAGQLLAMVHKTIFAASN